MQGHIARAAVFLFFLGQHVSVLVVCVIGRLWSSGHPSQRAAALGLEHVRYGTCRGQDLPSEVCVWRTQHSKWWSRRFVWSGGPLASVSASRVVTLMGADLGVHGRGSKGSGSHLFAFSVVLERRRGVHQQHLLRLQMSGPLWAGVGWVRYHCLLEVGTWHSPCVSHTRIVDWFWRGARAE